MAAGERVAVEVRDIEPGEMAAAVAVLARGMRDNPIHVAAFGDDPERRRRALERMFTGFFRIFGTQRPIVALDGETIVGVTGIAPPGTCQPTPVQGLRVVPGVLAMGFRSGRRVGKWFRAWAERDHREPHTHLGPLAVDAHLQGRGIGSQVLAEHVRRLDAAGEVGYLETDKPENVRLYERFGYRVVGEADVIGVANWFMVRPARGSGEPD